MSVDFIVDIDPADFSKVTNAIERDITAANRRASEKLGKMGVRLLKGFTRTWNHQPEFQVETEGTRDSLVILIGTDDPVFGYLDQGTRVRRAVMSRDFVAKTRPGSLKSGPGRGGVVFIGRNVNRPGIKARNATGRTAETLEKQAEPTFNRELKRVR
jgi:hypothetical protein